MRNELFCEKDSRIDDISIDDTVDHSKFLGLSGRHGLAREHHVSGGGDWDEPRHALRAAGARDDPERKFWQTQARIFVRDPIMAGERDFCSGAQRCAVNSGDDGHRRVLDQTENFVIARWTNAGVKFFDVGTRDESFAGTAQYDRFDVRPGAQLTEFSQRPLRTADLWR